MFGTQVQQIDDLKAIRSYCRQCLWHIAHLLDSNLGHTLKHFRVTPCITSIFSHENKCDLTFKHLQLSLTSLGSVEPLQIKEQRPQL